jgi:hypothetical protein
MTAVCTFAGVTVPSRLIRSIKMVGAAGALAYEAEIECVTETFSEYTALAALYAPCGTQELIGGTIKVTSSGTKGSLVLNGNTYTNCYIKDLSAAEVQDSNLGVWTFTTSFVRDTST